MTSLNANVEPRPSGIAYVFTREVLRAELHDCCCRRLSSNDHKSAGRTSRSALLVSLGNQDTFQFSDSICCIFHKCFDQPQMSLVYKASVF